MITRYGAKDVRIDEHTSATVATSTIVVALAISTTGQSHGAKVAQTMHTSARSVMCTTLMAVMVTAKKVGMSTAIVSSMTTVTDLMHYSTQPTRMSDYTLV
jgi:hypothetical protein